MRILKAAAVALLLQTGIVSVVQAQAQNANPLSDVRVRQAIAYAIDRNLITESVFGDVDGTVVVPKAIMREALNKALEKVAAENVVRDEIRAGHSLVDIFDRHGIL